MCLSSIEHKNTSNPIASCQHFLSYTLFTNCIIPPTAFDRLYWSPPLLKGIRVRASCELGWGGEAVNIFVCGLIDANNAWLQISKLSTDDIMRALKFCRRHPETSIPLILAAGGGDFAAVLLRNTSVWRQLCVCACLCERVEKCFHAIKNLHHGWCQTLFISSDAW